MQRALAVASISLAAATMASAQSPQPKSPAAVMLAQTRLLGQWSADCQRSAIQELYVDEAGDARNRVLAPDGRVLGGDARIASVEKVAPDLVKLTIISNTTGQRALRTYKVLGNKIQVWASIDTGGRVIVAQGLQQPLWSRCNGDARASVILYDGTPPTGAPSTQRPSFDCTKATSAAARLMCAEPELAALDAQLGETYRSRRAALTGAEQLRFQDEQVKWIRSRNQRCNLENKSNAAVEELQSAKSCMVAELKARREYLQSSSQAQQPHSSLAAKLQAGTYVAADVPCQQVSYSVAINFDGTRFTGSKNYCAVLEGPSLPGSYPAKACPRTTEEDAESFAPDGQLYTLKSATEFSISGPPGGNRTYRLCEQRSLPEAWRSSRIKMGN